MWFHELTGLRQDDPETVRRHLRVEGESLVSEVTGRRLYPGRLSVPSLAELRARPADRGASTTLREQVADARALHADPANAGAVFQVASQFNLLEMICPDVTPEQGIARYSGDPTQGPACAMACGAGTLWRNYFVPLGGQTGQTRERQIDAAADLHAALGGDLWDMRNGYLLPRRGGLSRAATAIAAGEREALMGTLRVGVQEETEVTLPGAGHRVTQVYASAVPVAYAREPARDWEPLARLVLDAAYEATLRAALDRPGPVYLTRLGGGAFGNVPAWIDAAIDRAVALLDRAGLDLRMVVRPS